MCIYIYLTYTYNKSVSVTNFNYDRRVGDVEKKTNTAQGDILSYKTYEWPTLMMYTRI